MITYFLITYIFDNDNRPEERVIRFIQWKLYIYIEKEEFHVCTIIDSRSMKKYQSFDQINENISNDFILMEYHLLDTNN